MNKNPFKDIIASEEVLREICGNPGELVKNKTITYLDEHCQQFIARSGLIFMSTSNRSGSCDVSPRGDGEGFVHVVDQQHLVIPERPGNRRFDSLLNILSNPHIGLIFVIPGLDETLRINGRAAIIQDRDLMTQMQAQGKTPKLGIAVTVEECYMHCGKAFKRSHTWEPESWPAKEQLPKPARIIAAHAGKLGVTEDEVARSLKETYEKRLY
ncbi:pyridoxamine 5'-phosphate oxidase family protein [Paenibacillus xylanilyticus]|uniref:pyridoxamine 5'-phosphate oxidase family protein n=1 Tax=Paenibacillus xylanilyticus TaxID=248903 RepID=UPI0039A2AEF4